MDFDIEVHCLIRDMVCWIVRRGRSEWRGAVRRRRRRVIAVRAPVTVPTANGILNTYLSTYGDRTEGAFCLSSLFWMGQGFRGECASVLAYAMSGDLALYMLHLAMFHYSIVTRP